MEVLDYFRRICHSDGIRVSNCWYELETEYFEIDSFLKKSQHRSKPLDARLEIRDIRRAIEAVSSKVDHELINKVVVQKVNTDVSGYSSTSGYWTHLAFLYLRVTYNSSEWFIYAYARARIKPLFLDIERDHKRSVKLGLTHFVSVNQKQKNKSMHI